jgi:preprotein translocase subunit SecG
MRDTEARDAMRSEWANGRQGEGGALGGDEHAGPMRLARRSMTRLFEGAALPIPALIFRPLAQSPFRPFAVSPHTPPFTTAGVHPIFSALMWLSILIPILLTILVIVCVLLVLVVLMQRPRSEGLGAAFGSGMTENIFGAQTTTVLTKATVYLGGIFFGVTLILTILVARQSAERRVGLLENEIKTTKPAPTATVAPGTSAVPAPTVTPSGNPTTSATPQSSAIPQTSATPATSATPETSATPLASATPALTPTPVPSPTAATKEETEPSATPSEQNSPVASPSGKP